jgi:hypothetical protein
MSGGPGIVDFAPAERALLCNDLPALCRELKILCPHDPHAGLTEQLARFALGHEAALPEMTGPPATFLDSIARARVRLNKPASVAQFANYHLHIGRELDFIADSDAPDRWSVAQCLNRLLLGRINPTQMAAVVGTMRDDGIYILDWIAHYQAMGFQHIFLYTNDNSDGSEELLRLLAGHGVITLIESETGGTVPPEGKAFGHALHLLHDLRDFEWALFVDSDEYLVLADEYRNSIANVFAAVDVRFPEQRPVAICYDWLWFVSGMAFQRTPGLLLERFQYARPHWLTKPLVQPKQVVSMRRQHFPEIGPSAMVVDSALDPLDLSSIWQRQNAQYRGGRINHYWPRSFQEFAVKKARGATLKLKDNLYDRPFRKFFEWNGPLTRSTHHPPDAALLDLVRQRRGALMRLEGVASAASRIERDFPAFLARLIKPGDLRAIYEDSRTDPQPL